MCKYKLNNGSPMQNSELADNRQFLISKQTTITLKILLAFNIYACHIASYSNISQIHFLRELGEPSVAIFMFLSGYGICASYSEKKKYYIDNFISKRIISVIIPLIVAFVFYQAFFLIKPLYSISELKSVFYGYTYCILPFSWYIFAQVYFYISFLVSVKTEKRNIGCQLFAFSTLYFFVLKFLSFPAFWTSPSFCFVFGYLSCDLPKNNRIKIYLLIVGLNVIGSFFSRTLLMCLIATIIPHLTNVLNLKEYNIILSLSKRSYYIYIAQAFGVYIFYKFYKMDDTLLQLVLSIIITLTMSEIIYRTSLAIESFVSKKSRI